MTAENDPISILDPPVTCFCGRTFTAKGSLIVHLEHHGVITLAREIGLLLIKMTEGKGGGD